MSNGPVWHVDITRAASLSRENRPFRDPRTPRSIVVVDDVGEARSFGRGKGQAKDESAVDIEPDATIMTARLSWTVPDER
jgi:hypothetical protein